MIENIMRNLKNTRRLQIVAQLNSVADPGGGGGELLDFRSGLIGKNGQGGVQNRNPKNPGIDFYRSSGFRKNGQGGQIEILKKSRYRF